MDGRDSSNVASPSNPLNPLDALPLPFFQFFFFSIFFLCFSRALLRVFFPLAGGLCVHERKDQPRVYTIY